MEEPRPKVGVGLIIVRDGKILCGKRRGSHGEGQWGTTGGHLEHLESFENCARRELREEAGDGLKIKNLRFQCVSNITAYAPKQYVDIGMVAEWESGEPEIIEPDRLERWEWFPLDALPEPLFAPVRNYIEAYKTGKTYFAD